MAVSVRAALESSLRRLGVVRKVKRAQAVYIWDEVVGQVAAHASEAVACKDGILFVAVKNSVWASELSLLKLDIIRKLNRRLGRGTVKDLRFQARGIGWRKHEERLGPGKRTGAQEQGRALTQVELAEIKELARNIADPTLRSTFVRALTAARRRALPPGGV